MKLKNLLLILIIAFTSLNISAQNINQKIVIPLSMPDQVGTLYADVYSGKITVNGYSGKEVIIEASVRERRSNHDDCDHCDEVKESKVPEGMRIIDNNSFSLDAVEKENKVYVQVETRNQTIDLNIQVPENFLLKLESHRNGGILIENVKGAEIEVECNNGDVSLQNIASPVVIDAHRGDVDILFAETNSENPTSVTTYSGDINITFPAKSKAVLKFKSENGNVYADEKLNINANPPKVISSSKNGANKYSIENWMYAQMNGGGSEFQFSTYRGNVFIRVN